MPSLSATVRRVLPPDPLARRLSVQSMLFAVGEGTFITGNAVFFTHIVGLSAAQVGLGLTIAGLLRFAAALPLGRLADKVGARRTWAIAAALEAAIYLVYPWLHGFAAFVVVICVVELFGAWGHSARGAYVLDSFPREERVRWQAYMRSALNIGFTAGALIGGVALATNSDRVIQAVPLLTAAILAVNAALITRLPQPAHKHVAEPDAGVKRVGALRNRGFLALSFLDGVLTTNQVLLNVVIPLWLVQRTDAPRVVLAWLFATNTVMAVLLQVPAARGVDSVAAAVTATRRSAGFFVLSCVIVAVTHSTVGLVTVVLLWVGHVTVTGAELFESAAQWAFVSELSDPAHRAEYQGANDVGSTLGFVWAPAAYTFLAMNWGDLGWAIIAAGVAVAAALTPAAARAAERHLRETTGILSPAAPAPVVDH